MLDGLAMEIGTSGDNHTSKRNKDIDAMNDAGHWWLGPRQDETALR